MSSSRYWDVYLNGTIYPHGTFETVPIPFQADFHVIQPGSSVATSLSQGESQPKHVVLLEIRADSFRSTFIPLRNIRPFDFSEVVLAELNLVPQTDDAIAECLARVGAA